jgi:ribosomal-protein-alanine N-acetyltransferase
MIRPATTADIPELEELWRAFGAEVPEPPYVVVDERKELEELHALVREGIALVAESDGGLVGFALAHRRGPRHGFLSDVYVRPEARRSGVARALVHEVATRLREQGAEALELEVVASNEGARAVYERWGFEPVLFRLVKPIDALVDRLVAEPSGPTFGSIHVQTDDAGAVERAVHKVLPRLGRSEGTTVSGPRNGWVAVHDELCDREPQLLQRLARELSYALASVVLAIGVDRGAVVHYNLWDRGTSVDEYRSLPEYFGPLPPGDVVALGANPTVVARLTGADPGRVREVARTAATLSELPPAGELIEAIAAVMGVADAGHGWVAS